MLCIGHRGACGHAPENTLASVRKAVELGAPCIEVDVYSVDGEIVVFHDARLDRTTNGSGYLLKQRAGEIRLLDAGNGERVPTLLEILETVDGRAGINIELIGPHTVEPVLQLVSNFRSRDWIDDFILISSFDHRQLARLRQLEPRIKTGALIKGLLVDDAAFAEKLGAYSVHPSLECIDRQFVEDAHIRGLRVFVYTVNHPDDISMMRDLDVDGVFTDYPERVLQHDRGVAIGWN